MRIPLARNIERRRTARLIDPSPPAGLLHFCGDDALGFGS